MVLLILLVAIISVVSLYSAYNVLKDRNNNKTNEKSNIFNNDDEEIEVIDDTKIYKSLDRSIEVVNHLNTSLNSRVTDIYKNEINISDVDKNNRIYSVLLYLYDEKNYDHINEEDYNRLFDGLYMEEKKEYYGSINMDDVSSLYKKVYNEELETGLEINIDNYCPIFKYDNNKYYFGTYDCENVRSKVVNYKYKYVIGDNSADVYIALGVLEYDINFKTYKYDMYKNTYLKESDTDILLDINRNNYDEYSKYIVHFVKENGDFYVNSVRKVMD